MGPDNETVNLPQTDLYPAEEHVTEQMAADNTAKAEADAISVGELGFAGDPRTEIAAKLPYESISTAGPDIDAEAKVESISSEGFQAVADNLGAVARADMGEQEGALRDKAERTDESIILNETNVDMEFDVPKVDLAGNLHENQPAVEQVPDNVVPLRPVADDQAEKSGEGLDQIAG